MKRYLNKMVFLFLLLMVESVSAQFSSFDQAIKLRATQAEKHLMANISRSDTPAGFIVASPSKIEPNYYYHWIRDAALVMRSLNLYLTSSNVSFQKQIELYAKLEAAHQSIYKLSDQGEPKFNADGTSFQGPWGRPQNDGPALRSSFFSNLVLAKATRGDLTDLKKYYQANLPARSLLKIDYEYISHQWFKPDFDLWEEIQGQHFYTRMVQQYSLKLAAKVAALANDKAASDWYNQQIIALELSLAEHVTNQKIILSTIKPVAGLGTKKSMLDSSVILAILHTDRLVGNMSLSSEEVVKTFILLDETFKKLYPINQKKTVSDSSTRVSYFPELGTAIGRYPEDTFFDGNPWFLLTSSFAEFCYRQALLLKSNNKIILYSSNTQMMLAKYLRLPTNQNLNILANAWRVKGDQYIARVLFHVDADGHQAEQIDKNNGHFKSAADLTWSYAAYLSAVHYRSQALELLKYQNKHF